MNTKDKSKLNGKDLISIGIFTAVYFILNLLIAAAMGFIPLVNMMIPFASSLVLGIPMMLYFSKIKKFGMVLITYILRRDPHTGRRRHLQPHCRHPLRTHRRIYSEGKAVCQHLCRHPVLCRLQRGRQRQCSGLCLYD